MALQTPISFRANEYEGLRYQLETVGFVEDTYMADGFDDSPVAVTTIDRQDFPATFPVPVDSVVTAIIKYSSYKDAGTDAGRGGIATVTASRDGAGDVTLTGNSAAIGNNGTAADLVVTFAANTDNQGVEVRVAGATGSTANYFLARAELICAKKGGLHKKYVNVAVGESQGGGN